jgi:hypothetical protein
MCDVQKPRERKMCGTIGYVYGTLGYLGYVVVDYVMCLEQVMCVCDALGYMCVGGTLGCV